MYEPKWEDKDLNRILEESRQMPTPFYLLDENRLKNNIVCLKEKTEDLFSICFSVKANPWYAVSAMEYADYVEVCSPGEWELCRKQGISPRKMIVGGIYKSDAELKELVAANPHRISIESMQQLRQVNAHGAAGGGADILLRISSGNQFGMDPELVIDLLQHQDRFPALRFKGIHYYSGTQKRQLKDIDKDIALLESVGKKAGDCFTEIEYGPGLGVPQFDRQDSCQYEDFLSELTIRLKSLSEHFRITLECGRLLAADTGIYVTEIVDIKTNKDRIYYIVDGGIHHLQYYGQIKGQLTPFVYGENVNEAAKKKEITICGALCTVNDILAHSIYLPEMKTGTRLAFMNAGAYCTTEGISLFLSRDLPSIVMDRQRQLVIMRGRTDSYPLNMRQ